MTSGARLWWYWHRLHAMDGAEISARVRTGLGWGRVWSAKRALKGLRIAEPASTAYPRLPDPSSATPGVRAHLAREATAIREGRWQLFGWKKLELARPPVWHRDYFHGADVAARRVNYRHLPGGADARCVWEINRWSELTKLAQNAWINDQVGDAKLAQVWLVDWCDRNPVGVGINWCSSLEAGLRLVNFCWVDALIRRCGDPLLRQRQDALVQRIVPSHAWWIWHHRSPGSSANNHVLGELAALVVAAQRWPAVAAVACSTDRAWEMLAGEVMRQFNPDGGNGEQALHYHLFAWELAWHASTAMGARSSAVAARLGAAAHFFCNVAHVHEPWDFGDSDDAEVVPLRSERENAAAEWKAWMRCEDEDGALGFWLGSAPAWLSRAPGASPRRAGEWTLYKDSGQATLEANGWKARLDGSPLGFGAMAAHGHLDAMHLSLWDGPCALVVDPGTGAYFGDPESRTKLASWEMHNGPVPLSGRTRPLRMGLFLWAHHHAVPTVFSAANECSVHLECEGHHVTRVVQFLPAQDSWRITDLVDDDQLYAVRWRLSPAWVLIARAGQCFTLASARGHRSMLALTRPDGDLRCELGQDIVSPRFGRTQLGLVISAVFSRRLVSEWSRVGAG